MERITRVVLLVQLQVAEWAGRPGGWPLPGAREGQSTIEWVLIAATLAVGVVAALGVLTGAISDYFTSLANWLSARRPT